MYQNCNRIKGHTCALIVLQKEVSAASSGRLIDISVGSVLRALIEANAAIALWVQWLVLLSPTDHQSGDRSR